MTVSKTSNSTSSQSLSPKLRFYRQCRLWHGYLSAFAFIALLFFAVTGVLLNHPTWLGGKSPRTSPTVLSLTPAQVQDLRNAPHPGERLTAIVAAQISLLGEFKDGTLAMNQVFARLRGARGSSDLRANLDDGSVSVMVERTNAMGVLNALHRGETAGEAWRFFIDMLAGILIAMALAGYAIFLSMTARLKIALAITGSSVAGAVLLFALMVK